MIKSTAKILKAGGGTCHGWVLPWDILFQLVPSNLVSFKKKYIKSKFFNFIYSYAIEATVCWYLVHRQMRACSYSTLILVLANQLLTENTFFHCKKVFLKASFISAWMIVVNLLFFRSIQFCFVHLRFQEICLWRIRALKEERNMNELYFLVFFVLFVLNVIVFDYNRLK